jgi:hypothetical protein
MACNFIQDFRRSLLGGEAKRSIIPVIFVQTKLATFKFEETKLIDVKYARPTYYFDTVQAPRIDTNFLREQRL